MRGWRNVAMALALIVPAPALACSPVPPPETPPTQAQIDRDLRSTFAAAPDIVEYVVIKRATSSRNGAIRVTRAFKGTVKPGTVIPIWTSEGAACGAGDANVGDRGRMFLERGKTHRYAPISDWYFAEFVRLGLVPAQ